MVVAIDDLYRPFHGGARDCGGDRAVAVRLVNSRCSRRAAPMLCQGRTRSGTSCDSPLAAKRETLDGRQVSRDPRFMKVRPTRAGARANSTLTIPMATRCGSRRDTRVDGDHTPGAAFGPALREALDRAPGSRFPKPEVHESYRQYLGFVVGGRRIVYINGAHERVVQGARNAEERTHTTQGEQVNDRGR